MSRPSGVKFRFSILSMDRYKGIHKNFLIIHTEYINTYIRSRIYTKIVIRQRLHSYNIYYNGDGSCMSRVKSNPYAFQKQQKSEQKVEKVPSVEPSRPIVLVQFEKTIKVIFCSFYYNIYKHNVSSKINSLLLYIYI